MKSRGILGQMGLESSEGFGRTHPFTLWSWRCWEKSLDCSCRSREHWSWALHSGHHSGLGCCLAFIHLLLPSHGCLKPGNPDPSGPEPPCSHRALSCAKLGSCLSLET